MPKGRKNNIILSSDDVISTCSVCGIMFAGNKRNVEMLKRLHNKQVHKTKVVNTEQLYNIEIDAGSNKIRIVK